MKLNIGCGHNKLEGYVNVDWAHDPDVRVDLEKFPWPWEDSSVDEVRAHHILEHLGSDTKTFVGVIKEMYRVMKGGAVLDIVVPHPRHDDFLNDPTHVRPITLNVMALFSKSWNRKWEADGSANSKLALEHDVDFEPKEEALQLEPHITAAYEQGRITDEGLRQLIKERNNIVKAIHLKLECVK